MAKFVQTEELVRLTAGCFESTISRLSEEARKEKERIFGKNAGGIKVLAT